MGAYCCAHAELFIDGCAINNPLEVGHGTGIVDDRSSTCQATGSYDFGLISRSAEEMLQSLFYAGVVLC